MSDNKRPAPAGGATQGDKRAKHQNQKGKQGGKKQWRTPKQAREGHTLPPAIEAGDSGIWATCELHKEAKCVGELKDLFYRYAEELYGEELDKMRKQTPATESTAIVGDAEAADEPQASAASKEDDLAMDIEAEIAAEVNDMRKPTTDPLFTNVKVEVQCVLFLKTRQPIEPVSFIRHICADLLADPTKRRTRYLKRLTPMTMMGKATETGLDTIAKAVLAPHFHDEGVVSKKYAIRPSSRNHDKPLDRDYVIKTIADMVGKKHTVDLNKPDLVILVEVYTNVCGMSVVPGADFERMKRYNIAEIGAPPVDKSKKAEE